MRPDHKRYGALSAQDAARHITPRGNLKLLPVREPGVSLLRIGNLPQIWSLILVLLEAALFSFQGKE
jgi:hypothetical protein